MQSLSQNARRIRLALEDLSSLFGVLFTIVLAAADIWICWYMLAFSLDKGPIVGFSLMAATQIPLLLISRRNQILRWMAYRNKTDGWYEQRKREEILKELSKTKHI